MRRKAISAANRLLSWRVRSPDARKKGRLRNQARYLIFQTVAVLRFVDHFAGMGVDVRARLAT